MRSRLALSILEKSYLPLFFKNKNSFVGSFSYFMQWNQNFRSLLPRNFSYNDREASLPESAGARLNGDPKDLKMRLTEFFTEGCEDSVLTEKLRMLQDATPGLNFWEDEVLASYLSLPKNSQREKYWNVMKLKDSGKSLPTILVHFMHINSIDIASRTCVDLTLFDMASETLISNGLEWTDVEDWAYIVSADSGDKMATRIYESRHKIQPFVLILVLRQYLKAVRSFEILLLCTWDLVLGKRRSGKNPRLSIEKELVDLEENSVLPDNMNTYQTSQQSQLNSYTSDSYPHDEVKKIGYQIFIRLARLLLKQARRIWPATLTNIAQLISSFTEDFVIRAKCDPQRLPPNLSRILCYIIDIFIRDFSHPSKAEPYLLITNNWNAQKTLLKLAAKFKPALVLSHDSYRAIVLVFAAHKKTPKETENMLRRSRYWPPWIVPQNGMDAENPTDDVSTRVTAAIARLKEAGYGGDWFDEALSIIGGQEFDGTPTIQTRRMLPWPSTDIKEMDEAELDSDHLNPNVWAARITATRDIQEAWSAFSKFRKLGGFPNQETYLAMFEKLKFDSLLENRQHQSPAVPGDGLEVLPVPDNNFSDYYRRHLQPPSLEDLYSDMLRYEITPSGDCLSFLVRNARTPDDGFRYLRASGLSNDMLQTLGASSRPSHLTNVPEIPPRILADYIHLICRFVPRAVEVSYDTDSTEKKTKWTILQLQSPSSFGIALDHPLHLAAYLLNSQRPSIVTPWYSFFRILSFSNTVISPEFVGTPRNDILAWRVLKASLHDFLNCGHHLNPIGFILICRGLDKYLRATFEVVEENQSDIDDACQLVKAEFKKLQSVSLEENGIPKLYYNVRGVHLHAYIRCLALTKDLTEIVSLIEWMVSNKDELHEISQQESIRGQSKNRKVMVVARICCEGTFFEAHVRDLIESVSHWNGWPTDEEVSQYSNYASSREEFETGLLDDDGTCYSH
ncbi:hypothetical protein K3495_g1836 [Podosphaera aphanis]|nr:hypothetical protein K3495_g1836 [Podosphaera aphanis]